MATLVGFQLGIHVPLTRLIGGGNPERTLDLVQAHGQAQLLGFAGLFVIGMSLRLMPRFAGARIAFEGLVPVMLATILAGLLLRAVLMPWFDGGAHAALLFVAVIAVLAGSGCFLLIALGTLAVEARRFEASSLALVLGAAFLFAGSAVSAFVAIDVIDRDARALPYLANNAVAHLHLSGFLLCFILGVGLRAIPAMVGVERPGKAAGILAVVLALAVAALTASLLYLEYGTFAKAVVLAADGAYLALGAVMLLLVWLAGVVRQAANRLRPASQPHLWLVRSAFSWMVVSALSSVYFGGKALLAAELPDQFGFDAARHALGAGAVTTLIAGMSLMILPEFAAERQRANRQRLLALALAVLLNAAALLRVIPSLAGAAWSADARNFSMALGGALAEIALLAFALYLGRLLLRQRHG
jgi:hypothetical protein